MQTNERKNISRTLEILDAIRSNIEQVIIGKTEVIDSVLTALVSGGHILLEDVPGLGKTTLVAALARSIDCSFQRIQFTPDVLPSDVTGFSMLDLQTGEKEFHQGAIMSQIVLADEINRTSPKTQSALLQAMQEGQVTVDGETYPLPKPFMVLATQNPVELTGTYPLPEAQLDRFLMRISVGYPEQQDEVTILKKNKVPFRTELLAPVANQEDILFLQKEHGKILCADSLLHYIVTIARKTREHPEIELGVSPRGSIALLRAAMGRAMLEGRGYVLPDDIQAMLSPVLAHRLVLESQGYVQNRTPEIILREIVKEVPVPAVKGS